MNIQCTFGLHKWKACKCVLCGKQRDQEHDWVSDCDKCSVCAKTRYKAHTWKGCVCSACGQIRGDEHIWNGTTCKTCGTNAISLMDEKLQSLLSTVPAMSFDDAKYAEMMFMAELMIFPSPQRAGALYYMLTQLRTRIAHLETAKTEHANAWTAIETKYGQYISKPLDDSATFSVVLNTFYRDHSHADRVLSAISNEIAGKLRPTNQGVSSLSGASRYHITHEGHLNGAQVKEYLITVVGGDGEIYEVLL